MTDRPKSLDTEAFLAYLRKHGHGFMAKYVDQFLAIEKARKLAKLSTNLEHAGVDCEVCDDD